MYDKDMNCTISTIGQVRMVVSFIFAVALFLAWTPDADFRGSYFRAPLGRMILIITKNVIYTKAYYA